MHQESLSSLLHQSPFLEASLVAFRNDGYVGVTPGLKAFPSCLIDNNALARTFLPGRAGTTLVPIPPPTYCCHCRHWRKNSSNGGSRARWPSSGERRWIPLANAGEVLQPSALDSADRWRGGYDRQQSWLSVNSLPFCVTVDERSPSSSTDFVAFGRPFAVLPSS